jgi:hypothetical protein
MNYKLLKCNMGNVWAQFSKWSESCEHTREYNNIVVIMHRQMRIRGSLLDCASNCVLRVRCENAISEAQRISFHRVYVRGVQSI